MVDQITDAKGNTVIFFSNGTATIESPIRKNKQEFCKTRAKTDLDIATTAKLKDVLLDQIKNTKLIPADQWDAADNNQPTMRMVDRKNLDAPSGVSFHETGLNIKDSLATAKAQLAVDQVVIGNYSGITEPPSNSQPSSNFTQDWATRQGKSWGGVDNCPADHWGSPNIHTGGESAGNTGRKM